MALRVIEADLDDAQHARAILRILDAYARDPMGGGESLPAAVREAVIPGLRAHPGSFVLLAREGAEAVGMAVCFTGFSTFRAAPLVNLHDLAVLAEHRGRGVGRALLEALEERARELGCCKLTLEVREDNGRARGLYESFGFGHFAPGEAQTPTRFLEKPLG